MDFKIITKPTFTILGKIGQGPSDTGPEWIKPLWENTNQKFDEIKHLVISGKSGPHKGAWGLMSDITEKLKRWEEEGKYMAGWEVEPGTKPLKGWNTWTVPEQMFVVIPCTIATYVEVINYVYQTFLPAEGYKQTGAIHEYYPEDFHDAEKDTLELYFPITK